MQHPELEGLVWVRDVLRQDLSKEQRFYQQRKMNLLRWECRAQTDREMHLSERGVRRWLPHRAENFWGVTSIP